jgi:hypothetical protein
MLLSDVKNYLSCNPGCYSTYLRASFPAVAAIFVKGFTLPRESETIDFAITNLMNLLTKRVADSVSEEAAKAIAYLHRSYMLLPIFESFSAD